MQVPTEYTVVSAIGLDDFINAVNQQIEQGWIPIGGISSFFINLPKEDRSAVALGMDYCQAMVKY